MYPGIRVFRVMKKQKGANNQGKNLKSTEGTPTNNPPSPKVQPKVIVIGKILQEHQTKGTKIADTHLTSTPKRKPIKDNSDTPVPGCINGSCFDNNAAKLNDKMSSGKEKQITSIKTDQIIRVMNNMETVLETVLLGINQSREVNLKFKTDVTKKLEEITSQQIQFAESLSNIKKEVNADKQNACSRMEIAQASISMEDNMKLSQDVTRKLDEIASKQQDISESQSTIIKDLSTDKKNVNCRVDGLKSSLHVVETSCSDLKKNLDKASTANKKECDEIQNVGRKIYEAISEVRNESKRSREQMVDIERSISAISEAGMFTSKEKQKKAKDCSVTDGTHSISTQTESNEGEENEDDVEITFAKVVSEHAKDSQQKNSGAGEETDSIVNKALNDKRQQQARTGNRKEKVCLIGDCIAGQLNIPMLGKSTNTYVRRLRAPKINDIGTHTDEVKDAKLIINHTGVNNIRDKESTESCVNLMMTAISKLRETATDAKIVVSKIIPVGDRELSIECCMFNASCEKKVMETHKEIRFLDHSNLAEQGKPIKTLYKPDMIHLSYNGVINFGTNLKKGIDNLSTNKETTDASRENNKPTEGGRNLPGRNYWYNDRRHTDTSGVDRHRDGQYEYKDSYDRRRSYDKQPEIHERGINTYRGRNNLERSFDRNDRDYYHESERRYEDRYDDYPSRDSRNNDYNYKDSGYSYHRQLDRNYYRY